MVRRHRLNLLLLGVEMAVSKFGNLKYIKYFNDDL